MLGLSLFVSRQKETGIMLGLVLGALGTVVALLPTYLIPVCPDVWHPCHIATRPALILLGVAIVIVSLIAIVNSRGGNDERRV